MGNPSLRLSEVLYYEFVEKKNSVAKKLLGLFGFFPKKMKTDWYDLE